MDGVGTDGQGPCAVDDMDACGKTVKFYDFSVEEIGMPAPGRTSTGSSASVQESSGNRPPEGFTAASGYGDAADEKIVAPTSPPTLAPKPAVAAAGSSDSSQCSRTQSEDCRNTKCCQEAGMQCYEKHHYWAACKETCVPGSTDPEDDLELRTPWSCQPFGTRTPKDAKAVSSSVSSGSGSITPSSQSRSSPRGK